MSEGLIADEDRGAFSFSGLNVERDTSWSIYATENEEISQRYEAVEPRLDAELNTIAKQGATRPYGSREINREILNILTLMSHDIRGPLNSVAAGLKLLKKGVYGTMAKGVSQEVDVLFAMVRRLIGSAEDFLARASSLDDGPNISREPLNVKEDVVDPLLQELSREIQERSLRMKDNLNAVPSDSLLVQGDRFWMRVILRNLLTNALKYASKGGRIAIGFENLRSHIKMSVFNTGTPIPEEYRDVLFTKFGRVLSRENQKTEGMGLGLYLVREIIQRQGGCVWYEPAVDGSIFSSILPNT